MGRRKIEIVPIVDERNRTITLNKRKAGLFKKAHELAVLCQVEVALVVITQDDRVHEYSTANNIKDIFKRIDRSQIAESKHPSDYGFHPGHHGDLTGHTDLNTQGGIEDDEESEPEESGEDDTTGKSHKSPRGHSLSGSISEHLGSRPRLKVQIPHSQSDPQKVAQSHQMPGVIKSLATEPGLDGSSVAPLRGSPHDDPHLHMHSQRSQNPDRKYDPRGISQTGDQFVPPIAQQQPQHRQHGYQMSPQQYGVPYNYQQYMLPYQQQQQQHQQQPHQHQHQQHPRQYETTLYEQPTASSKYTQPKSQQDPQQQNQAAQQIPQAVTVSPGGLYTGYHSAVGYGNFVSPMNPFSYSTGYGVAQSNANSSNPAAAAVPNAQQASSSSSASSNGGNGNGGNMVHPNQNTAGGGGQWNVFPNSPMNYVVSSNTDSAKPDPTGAVPAGFPYRQNNGEIRSPSTMMSMEWNAWDHMANGSQGPQSAGSRLVPPQGSQGVSSIDNTSALGHSQGLSLPSLRSTGAPIGQNTDINHHLASAPVHGDNRSVAHVAVAGDVNKSMGVPAGSVQQQLSGKQTNQENVHVSGQPPGISNSPPKGSTGNPMPANSEHANDMMNNSSGGSMKQNGDQTVSAAVNAHMNQPSLGTDTLQDGDGRKRTSAPHDVRKSKWQKPG